MNIKTLKDAGFRPAGKPGYYGAEDGWAIRYWRRRVDGKRVGTFDVMRPDGKLTARKNTQGQAIDYVERSRSIERMRAAELARIEAINRSKNGNDSDGIVGDNALTGAETAISVPREVIVYLRQLPNCDYATVDLVEQSTHTDVDDRYQHMTARCTARTAAICAAYPELRGTKVWATVMTVNGG